MTVTRRIDWRIGRRRLVLPVAVHALAVLAAIDLAREDATSWAFVGAVVLVATVISAVAESLRAWRDHDTRHELGLWSGGIAVDAFEYRVLQAWLGPGWTAFWLTASGQRRRLLQIWRGEVTDADHAALRRHVKALDFDV